MLKNYTLQTKIEHEYILFSFAKYRVCHVIVDMTREWIESVSRNQRYEEIEQCIQSAKSLASKELNTDVESLSCMSGSPLRMLFSFRSKEWEQEARNSLLELGMTQEDILNGKDLMMTDHSGLIMPKEY